jgi:LysR family transcriptional regulator, glycine cleavage system transcriptional activator
LRNIQDIGIILATMDRLPPLNALRAFEAAARHLSITRAAHELCVTVSAVSRQIKQLEDAYRTRLFVRGHHQIALTPQGADYFESVTNAFENLHDATRRLTKRAQRRQLKVRSYTTFAMRWMIPRLSGFHSEFPDIEVLLTASTDEVDFKREDIDCAVRLGDGKWHGANAYRLCSNVLVPVSSPGVAHRAHLASAADLKGEVLLHSIARPDDWEHWLRAVGTAKSIDPRAGMTYQNTAMALEAAIAGQGIAMTPMFLVEKDLADGKLVMPFRERLDMGDLTYYLLVPSDRIESLYMAKFRAWLLAQFAASEAALMRTAPAAGALLSPA